MIPYIDMHCDTLMQAYLHQKDDIYDFPSSMVDLKRLKSGNCKLQFFAIFMPPLSLKEKMGDAFPDDDNYIQQNYEIFQNTVKRNYDDFAQANSMDDLLSNTLVSKVSGMLTLEDGRAVNGNLERIKQFYDLGIRLISLTWNVPNCFGSPNSTDAVVMNQGLTDFGKDAIDYMNQLGILIDVSHLSDGGFWDVAERSKKTFVASHSNCRELNPHPRSMSDDMIRTLADKGGVIGLNFGPKFLIQDLQNQDSKLEYLIAQLKHMRNIGGIDCVAIGSDFDGVKGNLAINSPDKMPLLFKSLTKEGFSHIEIEKIAFKNVERVLKNIIR